MNQQVSVLERYTSGAQQREAALCCPVDYDPEMLAMLPEELVEKDYGCGDPSRYVRPGDYVLDLGSGGGKVCYLAAQIAGPEGHVTGVDMNDDMLGLARRFQDEMAGRLGHDRFSFRKGYIQDLALDLEAVDAHLAQYPLTQSADLARFEAFKADQREGSPLIPDASMDLVISNCVLNLVDDADKSSLVREIFRVLRPGGRIAISDIVSDKEVPATLKADPELWSGCISGAFEAKAFLDAFASAGFIGVHYDKWDTTPWQTVDDIVFRSATVVATRPWEAKPESVGGVAIYRGPYNAVQDEKGRVFRRGERAEVSADALAAIEAGVYGRDFIVDRPEPPAAGDCTGGCACG